MAIQPGRHVECDLITYRWSVIDTLIDVVGKVVSDLDVLTTLPEYFY
jgi:hypothetical protein